MKPKNQAPHMDAIELLIQDHRKVKTLFAEYDKLARSGARGDAKREIADHICRELTVHAQVEEEIFYPAARKALAEQDLLNEAEIEHATAKGLIARIEAMHPNDAFFDATVKVLGEYIDHHVEEEQNEMFPKARKSKLDLDALGQALAERKAELMEDLTVEEA